MTAPRTQVSQTQKYYTKNPASRRSGLPNAMHSNPRYSSGKRWLQQHSSPSWLGFD